MTPVHFALPDIPEITIRVSKINLLKKASLNEEEKLNIMHVLSKVSIDVRRHQDHGNSYKGKTFN